MNKRKRYITAIIACMFGLCLSTFIFFNGNRNNRSNNSKPNNFVDKTDQMDPDNQSDKFNTPENTQSEKTFYTSAEPSPAIPEQTKKAKVLSADTTKTPAGDVTSVIISPDSSETKIDLQGSPAAVAVKWTGGNLLYSLSNDGSTNEFKNLDINTDEASSAQNISELIFTNNEKYLLLKSEENKLANIQIDFIFPEKSKLSGSQTSQKGSILQYNLNSGAKHTSLPIISRDTWGAPLAPPDIDDKTRLTWDPYYYHVNRIIVHHTVTPNNPSDPAYYVRSVYLYHAVSKGWGDVGYNFLIDHLGNIYEGKLGGDEAKGYHAGQQANRGSVGIALLGDFTNESPTGAAKNALIQLMAEKAAFYDFNLTFCARSLSNWLNLGCTVFGHRDAFNIDPSTGGWKAEATGCPGNSLENELNSLATQAQSYKNSHFQDIKQKVQEVNNMLQTTTNPEKIYVKFNGNLTEQQMLNLIPDFSSIVNKEIFKNAKGCLHIPGEVCTPVNDPLGIVITVKDWDNGGFCPPKDWNDNGTYFPNSDGTKDRVRTLLKIFKLDPNVKSVSLEFTL